MVLEKLAQLQEYARKLDKDVLQQNPDLLKRILNSVSLRFGGLVDQESKVLDGMKDQFQNMRFQAALTETQLLLNEKLNRAQFETTTNN